MNKKTVFYVAFAVVIGSVAAFAGGAFQHKAVAASPNLIVNPGLAPDPTNANVPLDWHFGVNGTNDATGTYPVAGPDASTTAAQVSITSYTSGFADWFTDPAAAVAFAQYQFDDSYKSNAPTILEAQYGFAGTSTSIFTDVALLPSTNGAWGAASTSLTIPEGADSVSVFQILNATGSLAIANPSLVETAGPQVFPRGMVSLTFDDGLQTQYDIAAPMLKAAGLPGTFYIITQPMTADAANNNMLCNNQSVSTSCDGAVITATTTLWQASKQAPDPGANMYMLRQHYTSTAPVTVTISYFDYAGQPIAGEQNIPLGTFSQTANAQYAFANFTIPASIMSLTSSKTCGGPTFTIQETVPTGQTLAVITPELVEPQNLDIDDDYMTSQEVYALNAADNEIGDHTVNHCDLVTGLCPNADVANSPDPLSALQEIDEASSTLHGSGFTPVDTFAYPYGSYNTTAESLLQQDGFIAARSVNRGYNLMNSNRYTLEIQYVDASTTSEADFQNVVKPWIDYAAQNKIWLILLFHQIEPTSTIASTSDPDATTPLMLQDVINYVKQSNVSVVTLHDGVCMMNGMSSNPDCAHPVVYPAALPPSGYGNPPSVPSNYNEGVNFRVLTVTTAGLASSETASVKVIDSTSGNFAVRSVTNGSVPFAMITGDSYSVVAMPSNASSTVSKTATCSGAIANDATCTLTFSQ